MILQQGNDLVHMKNGFQERTALHKAAEYGDPVICQMLIQFGADADIKDAKQKPPLWFAAKNELKYIAWTKATQHFLILSPVI